MSAVRKGLEPHPGSPLASAVRSLTVTAERQSTKLVLDYALEGRLGEIRIPAAGPAARADELWKHTCFEAFVRPPGDAAYWEFNFAPSTSWQAYGFSDYRKRGVDPKVAAPVITAKRGPTRLELRAVVDLSPLKGPWQVALSAVVEDLRGGRTYWALRHPPGAPDFHHLRGFALTLEL